MNATPAALPHSPETEQSVLACALIDRDVAARLFDVLQLDDFHLPRHQLIFAAMLRVRAAGGELDLITVQAELDGRDELGKAGGITYLSGLLDSLPSVGAFDQYAAILHERRLRRELHATFTKAARRTLDGGEDAGKLLDSTTNAMRGIEARTSAAGPTRFGDVMQEAAKQIAERSNSRRMLGRSTGFKDLDTYTLGMEPGQLWIIAGRTGMGKSAFAQGLVEEVVFEQEAAAAVFSLEMVKRELGLRIVSSRTGIDHQRIRSGHVAPGELDKLLRATQGLTSYPLWIDDTSTMMAHEIGARARALRHRLEADKEGDPPRAAHPLSLVVVDHLQLLEGTGRENRNEDLAGATRAFKRLAKDLSTTAIALSQLSRRSDEQNRRPRLSDLRDSGAIEQDADVVLFVYRESYYSASAENKNEAELIIAKNRNGPTGTIHIRWTPEILSFSDPMKRDRYRQAELSFEEGAA